MKTLFRIFSLILIFMLTVSGVRPVAASEPIEIVNVEYSSIVAPDQSMCFKVTVKVNDGQLLASRGDMLRNTDGNLFGHWPHIAVVGTVNTGGTYTFECYSGMVAPSSEGVYESKWRVWRDGNWAGPEMTIRFQVQIGGGSGGYKTWNSGDWQWSQDGWRYKMSINYHDTNPDQYMIDKITLQWDTPVIEAWGTMATSPAIYSNGNKVWGIQNQIKLYGPTGGGDLAVAEFFPNVVVSKNCNEIAAGFVWSIQDIFNVVYFPYTEKTKFFPETRQDVEWVLGSLPPSKLEGNCQAFTPLSKPEDVIFDAIARMFSKDVWQNKFRIYLQLPFNVTIKWPGSDMDIALVQPNGTVLSLEDPNVTYTKTGTYISVTVQNPQVGEWQLETRAIEMSPDGESVQVKIQAANVLDADVTPPVTTLILSSEEGKNGWFVSDVTGMLNATDDDTATITTYYSIDNGNFIEDKTFVLSNDGIHDIQFYSIDVSGNTEGIQHAIVKIDKTPPVVAVTIDQLQYTRVQPFVVHYSGYDPEPGSGLAILTGIFNDQPVLNGQSVDMFWWNPGQYTLTATGEDYPGWVTTQSQSIQLIATIESLQQTVQRLCQGNYITKAGICNSLISKLNSALSAQQRGQNKTAVNILIAFQNEIAAQTDKSIKPEAKSILIMDSNYVIERLGGKVSNK
jgi:hypothetical protein